MCRLNELEEDALLEFFNMGLGKAADSLSQMVNNEVLLSLPQLKVISCDQATQILETNTEEKLVAIRQNFYGELAGTALLIFPDTEGLALVRTLLIEQISMDVLMELEQETLLDVGNVVLNAFLESFTQMMSLSFEFEAAEFLKGSSQYLLNIPGHLATQQHALPLDVAKTSEQAFVLMMDFKTRDEQSAQHTLNGVMILLFSQYSMEILKRELNQILAAY